MKLYPIESGNFKLDGGAMFGVVPKSIWKNINPPDENNMCSWALRCLLIEDGKRLILVDNVMGNKQNAKFFSYYYLHGDDTLDKSLASAGFSRNDRHQRRNAPLRREIRTTPQHLWFYRRPGAVDQSSQESRSARRLRN